MKVTFYPDKHTAIIPLDKIICGFEDMRQHALDRGLQEKPEIHITLLGHVQGEKIQNILSTRNEVERNEIQNSLEKIFDNLDCVITPLQKFYWIKKTETLNDAPYIRESIIQLCDVAVGDLYAKLSDLLKENITMPFPHITLYTKCNIPERMLRGIGVYSQEEFDEIEKEDLFVGE